MKPLRWTFKFLVNRKGFTMYGTGSSVDWHKIGWPPYHVFKIFVPQEVQDLLGALEHVEAPHARWVSFLPGCSWALTGVSTKGSYVKTRVGLPEEIDTEEKKERWAQKHRWAYKRRVNRAIHLVKSEVPVDVIPRFIRLPSPFVGARGKESFSYGLELIFKGR